MSEDDVIAVGRLRRRGAPPIQVTYDPMYGFRVEEENIPRAAAEAAAWCRKKGWLRLYPSLKRIKSVVVNEFLKAWSAGGA